MERLRESGVEDLAILHAFDAVPRHLFVPQALLSRAYDDVALPLGFGQTISRPSVHALYLRLAELRGDERVLEVGTGSGFQTALLATLAREVHSVERVPALAERARRRLAQLGLEARIHVADGSGGLPAAAPFDAILVAAAAPEVPQPLCRQLADGGRLVMPRGEGEEQSIVRVRRRGAQWESEEVEAARFVPLLDGTDPGSLPA